MAMYVSFSNAKDEVLHVDCKKEFTDAEINAVTSVQADGDELHYIEVNTINIPIRKNRRVVIWYGDHAKFIVGNF